MSGLQLKIDVLVEISNLRLLDTFQVQRFESARRLHKSIYESTLSGDFRLSPVMLYAINRAINGLFSG